MDNKKCIKCGIEKPNTEEFYSKNGIRLRTDCKECRKVYMNNYQKINKYALSDKSKEYYVLNKEKIKKRSNDSYYKEHELNKTRHKEYYYSNKEDIRKKQNENKSSELGKYKTRLYWSKNKQLKKEIDQRYRLKYSQELKLKKKEYLNTEQGKKIKKETCRRYSLSEKGKIKSLINSQKRIAKKNMCISNFSQFDWEECIKSFENKCAYCGNETKLTQEHVVPVSKLGEYTKRNIIPACKSCNSSKSNKEMNEWYSNHVNYSIERHKKIISYLEGVKTEYEQSIPRYTV